MISLTVVITLSTTGLILAVGLLISPGAISFLIVRKFSQMLWISIIICIFSTCFGTYLSFFIDSAPAPTIILVLTIIFILAFMKKQLFNPKKTNYFG